MDRSAIVRRNDITIDGVVPIGYWPAPRVGVPVARHFMRYLAGRQFRHKTRIRRGELGSRFRG